MAVDFVIGNDFDVFVPGAVKADGSGYLNGATGAFVMYTAGGVAVPGGAGALDYVTDSNGLYRGVIEDGDVTLVPGAAYYIIESLSGGGYDWNDRLDVVARAPGSVIIDAQYWMSRSGLTVTGADLASVEEICEEVSSALMSMCDPIQIVPLTLTLAAFDAPPELELHLPRPIRTISAIYVRYGANGDSSTLTAADLLTEFTDWYSPVTNKRKNWNGSGIVYRRGAGIWGMEYRRSVGNLAYSVDPNLGAVFVSALCGPASVDPAVKGAAFSAVTALFERRKRGAPLQSEGFNGYNYSLAGAFTAEAALASPEVTALLRSAGVLPIHVA